MRRENVVKKCILVFSSCEYSLKNRGDAAMLEGIVASLARRFPEAELVGFEMSDDVFLNIPAISGVRSPERELINEVRRKRKVFADSTATRICFALKGIGLIIRFLSYRWTGGRVGGSNIPYVQFFRKLGDAHVLLFAGGGYLNSMWWSDGLYAKVFPALVARVAGVKVVLSSQGLGPFKHQLDKFVAWALFSVASFIGVRDADKSALVVQEVASASLSKVGFTGDDALRGKVAPECRIAALLRSKDLASRSPGFIVVNFRDSSSYASSYNPPPFRDLAKLLDDLITELRVKVVFVPISYHEADGDRKSAQRIIENMQQAASALLIEEEFTSAELRGIIGKADLAIGTSYHFSLFALSQSVPAIGLYQDEYYKQKLDGLFQMYHQGSRCMRIRNVFEDAGHALVHQILAAREHIRTDLLRRNMALLQIFDKEHERMINAIAH